MNASSVADTKRYLSEAVILKHMNHENIMSLKGISKINGQYVTVTPLMVNGDLLKYLRTAPEEVRV